LAGGRSAINGMENPRAIYALCFGKTRELRPRQLPDESMSCGIQIREYQSDSPSRSQADHPPAYALNLPYDPRRNTWSRNRSQSSLTGALPYQIAAAMLRGGRGGRRFESLNSLYYGDRQVTLT